MRFRERNEDTDTNKQRIRKLFARTETDPLFMLQPPLTSLVEIPNFYAFNRVQAMQGDLPLLEHFGGPGSPVHCLAWVDDEVTEALVTRAPAGTRFIFVNMGADEDEAARWLDWGRTLDAPEEACRKRGESC